MLFIFLLLLKLLTLMNYAYWFICQIVNNLEECLHIS